MHTRGVLRLPVWGQSSIKKVVVVDHSANHRHRYAVEMAKSFALTKLVNRKLLKISGPDCYPYLQGLFCNDLRLLYEPDRQKAREHARVSSSVIGSFMLNAHGRAICDILIYRTLNTRYKCDFTPPGQATEPDELLIECESSIANNLAETLYAYRVRRKISLEVLNRHSVWCLYPKLNDSSSQAENSEQNALTKTSDLLSKTKETIADELTVVFDPRLSMMGLRILHQGPHDEEPNEWNIIRNRLKNHLDIAIDEKSIKHYIAHRYQLGLGEGPSDHPEAACLPLECNASLLGMVSFDKGCYLGQELTARIHFTGVIRKRLMPIIIDKCKPMPIIAETDIVEEGSKKKLGVIRNVAEGRGLALLRHDLIDDNTRLMHHDSGARITTWKPHWWAHNHKQRLHKADE